MSGGRGVQRGGGRERQHGPKGDDLSSQMGQLNVGGRPEYRRREPYERYTEKVFKANEKNSVGKKSGISKLFRFIICRTVIRYNISLTLSVPPHPIR